MRLYLTGFMGSGKTRVGQQLAARLGVAFVDLDGEIERAVGASVREIFDRGGEAEFRRLEREALERTEALDDAVIATGGGTLTFPENQAFVSAHGLSIWLHVPFAEIVARLGGVARPDRPLFRDEAQAFLLYRERLEAYRRSDLRIDVVAGELAEEVAARIELQVARRLSCAS